jgi:hypothetical protein
MKLRMLIGFLALVSGCTYAGSGSGEGSFAFTFDASKNCSGSGVTTTDSGRTEWSEAIVGSNCKITANWAGNLADMKQIRDKIDAELKKNGSSLDKADVTFKKVEVTFHSPSLDPPLAVSNIVVKVSVGADQLVDKTAGNMGALFDGTPVTLPSGSVDAALDAFKNAKALQASGTTSFDVALSSLPADKQTGNFTIQLLTDVDAELTIKQL